MLLVVLVTAVIFGLASPDTECSRSGKQYFYYPFYQGAQPISWMSTTPAPLTTTTQSPPPPPTTLPPTPPPLPSPTLPPPPITSVATIIPYDNYNYNNIYNEYLSTYINVPMYAGAQVIAVHPNKTQILQMQNPAQVYNKPPVILPPVPPPQTPPPPLPVPVPAKPSEIRPEFVIVDGMVPHKVDRKP